MTCCEDSDCVCEVPHRALSHVPDLIPERPGICDDERSGLTPMTVIGFWPKLVFSCFRQC